MPAWILELPKCPKLLVVMVTLMSVPPDWRCRCKDSLAGDSCEICERGFSAIFIDYNIPADPFHVQESLDKGRLMQIL